MSEYFECPHARELNNHGYCNHKWRKCHSGNGFVEPDLNFYVVDRNEVCVEGSLYGNYHFKITEEDIQALREGKVLGYVDEYGMFISM